MRNYLHEVLDQDLAPGEVLRGARVETGFSQEEMEEITGVNRSNLSALEGGELQMTSHYAEIFAAALDLHPADLLYPNRKFVKSKELLEVEKKAKETIRRHVARREDIG